MEASRSPTGYRTALRQKISRMPLPEIERMISRLADDTDAASVEALKELRRSYLRRSLTTRYGGAITCQ